MNIAVAGLWHLGTVTAACVAAAGHRVTAYDDNPEVVMDLNEGRPPIAEPGLDALIREGLAANRLRFTTNPADLAGTELLWICWDTPVDENDIADTDFVVQRTLSLLSYLNDGAMVLVSSQLPVGTVAQLEASDGRLRYACSPENLRLGKAIEVFRNADRFVVGVRNAQDRELLDRFFRTFTERVEWMSVESAEMTKHALNAYLATSITFINEIATLCEKTGADAADVARGLKTDLRIGMNARLSPGTAFAGGTLARDIAFLTTLGKRHQTPTTLLEGARKSNDRHKEWALWRIEEVLGDVDGKVIAILGLTYKPGTDTLRRSSAIELCRALTKYGAKVHGYDPALSVLPAEESKNLQLTQSAPEAMAGADLVMVSGAWPEFQSLTVEDFVGKMRKPVVLDPSRVLESLLGNDARVKYIAIGKAT
jgi:UDPglucose 6-dehydrogenase